jgi:Ca2+-binding EF-hand superfamily protein
MVGSVGGKAPQLSIDLSYLTSSQRHAEILRKLDANADGKIDESELQAVVPDKGNGKDAASIIKAANTNGDGGIDSSENDALLSKLEPQGKPKAPPPGPRPSGGAHGVQPGSSSEDHSKIFDRLDTNKDGKVSMQELLAATTNGSSNAGVEDLFKSIDSNADGSFTKNDLDSFLTKIEEEMKAMTNLFQSYNQRGKGEAGTIGQSIDSVM